MNPQIETGLAFILFLPAFAILSALYVAFPRQPRPAWRRVADAAAVLAAGALSIAAMRWGFAASAGAGGRLWPQIVATLLAYGVFMAVLVPAAFVRARWLRGAKAPG
jgi:hypothetical protein